MIKVEKNSKSFKDTKVLQDVSFDINKGDFVAQEYLDEYEELVMFELEAPELDNLSGNAVAIPKNNEELLKKINTAIQKLKDDGRLDELIDTWFNK